MRLLIIDDEPDLAATLLARVKDRGVDCISTTVASLASAVSALDTGRFDFVVCDLQIPTIDDALDADVAHGKAAYTRVRETMPGTPVVVLTAHGDEQTAADTSELAPHDDPFGTGVAGPMLQYAIKTPDLANCVDKIEKAATGLTALNRIDLSPSPEHLVVAPETQRVLRLFGKRRNGAVVHFNAIHGGLSDAGVFRVRVGNAQGAPVGLAVAKIAKLVDIEDEIARYNGDIVAMLPPSIFTPSIVTIRSGAGDTGGIFYSLEEVYDRSLFSLLAESVEHAADAVTRLKEGTQRWRDGRPAEAVSIGIIRRFLLSDECMALSVESKLTDIPWQEFEQREVQARICPQHSDLHGLNVIATSSGDARLIDYGLVGAAPASLDPVTLELSPIFHPSGPAYTSSWPDAVACAAWVNRDAYLDASPYSVYMQRCRAWAFEVAASNPEVFATVYAYAVRQLSFDGADVDRARGVIEACISELP